MAYNFKNLADVELLSAMPEEANVVVEVNGTTKRAPRAEVDITAELISSETLEEVPEGATVFAEVNGEIKRIPSDGLGGSGSGATPLLTYCASNNMLTNQNGENYDLTTLLDAYTQGQLFIIDFYSSLPVLVTGFSISGNVRFEPIYDDDSSWPYSRDEVGAYYSQKFGLVIER